MKYTYKIPTIYVQFVTFIFAADILSFFRFARYSLIAFPFKKQLVDIVCNGGLSSAPLGSNKAFKGGITRDSGNNGIGMEDLYLLYCGLDIRLSVHSRVLAAKVHFFKGRLPENM